MTVNDWTTEQWISFLGFVVAGLAALGLAGVGISAARARRAERREVAALIAGWRATPSHTVAILAGPTRPLPVVLPPHPLPTPPPPVVDPTGEILEHIAPGPGSLSSLAVVGEGSLTRVDRTDLVDADVRRWFVEAFDRPAHVPAPDEARVLDEGGVLTRWRAAVEPAMRTAHLWDIRGRGNGGVQSARQALDHWRIECPTGEIPLVEPASV